jgi:hypothetical protein
MKEDGGKRKGRGKRKIKRKGNYVRRPWKDQRMEKKEWRNRKAKGEGERRT